jgi:hypothetical protein
VKPDDLRNEAQYTTGKILRLWAVATLPLALLGWGVAPVLAARAPLAAPILYWLLMSAGMGWVCFVAFWIIRREEGDLSRQTLSQRLWLNGPRSPRTDQPQARLLWWLLPCLLIAFLGLALQLALMALVHSVWSFQFPHARWSLLWPAYANLLELVSPQYAALWWLGAGVMGLWFVSSLVAEETLFRGVLLPKMQGAFGRKDWMANGFLYAAFSIFQPWMIPVRVLDAFAIVWPVRRFRSLPMGIIVRGFSTAGLLAAFWLGFYEAPLKPLPASLNLPYICCHPQPVSFRSWPGWRAPLTNLPEFNPDNPWFSVDLRSRDASGLDLRDSGKDLEHADYDSQTIWPPKDRMPPGFDPAQILELGKNPGLGVRGLHTQGITGRGIGIGIVDHFPLTDHREYAGQVKWYEEINVWGASTAQMHGLAVASIAVGRTVGVAPEAELYFVGFGDNLRIGSFLPHYYAQGVRRLLQVSRRLPHEHRIRAMSLSFGPGPGLLGYEDFISAIKEAEAEGIFVAWCGEGRFPISGLGVAPAADRDDFQSYSVPPWILWRLPRAGPVSGRLFVPMDSRTTASPTGVNDYVFYGPGGASWTVPYAAGAYALAAQVAPDITPEQFWSLALKTGRNVQAKSNGRDVAVGPLINMAALVKALADKEGMRVK